MRKWMTPFLFLSALVMAGCQGNRDSSAAPVDESSSPDVLVKNAVEVRTSLSSIAGKGVIRIVDKPSRFGLTVNADIVGDESDRLRIRADKLAGAVQAFDVVKLGDDIGFYIPTRKVLYHGKTEDLRHLSFNFDPDDMLRQMLRPDTALLIRKWKAAPGAPNAAGNILAVEEDAPANRPRLRLELDRRTGRIVSLAQLDALGNPLLVKSYGDYRDLAPAGRRGSGRNANSVFPYLISFSWPREERMMELHFKAVDGNAVILDEDYDIAASSDTEYRPLNEAALESDPAGQPVASAAPKADRAERFSP